MSNTLNKIDVLSISKNNETIRYQTEISDESLLGLRKSASLCDGIKLTTTPDLTYVIFLPFEIEESNV